MDKSLKDYLALIAGIVDVDELEEVRKSTLNEVVSPRQKDVCNFLSEDTKDRLEKSIVDVLDKENPKAEKDKEELDEDGNCHCDHNHGMPEGWEVDPTNPITKKIQNQQEPKDRPLTHVAKWSSNTIALEAKKLVDKCNLQEGLCDIADEVSVKVPADVVLELSKIPSPEFATTIVISLGTEGVPLLYVKKCIDELGATEQTRAHQMLSALFSFPAEEEPVLGDSIEMDQEMDMDVGLDDAGCGCESAQEEEIAPCDCGADCGCDSCKEQFDEIEV